MTLYEAIKNATDRFSRAGIITSRLDAEVLLSEVLRKDRAWLITHAQDPLDTESSNRYQESIARRELREPLQYIIGRQEFRNLDFIVTPDVLIPRPETELLVETAVKTAKDSIRHISIIDLCTGSGCIAISLADEIPSSIIFALDKSEAALEIARENARKHGQAHRIRFLQGDLLEPLTELDIRGQVDIITANPPYVKSGEMAALQVEVRDYEPEAALDAGPQGTEIHERIILTAPAFLKENGCLIMEMGIGQAETLARILKTSNAYGKPEILKDLAGIDRVIVARKR